MNHVVVNNFLEFSDPELSKKYETLTKERFSIKFFALFQIVLTLVQVSLVFGRMNEIIRPIFIVNAFFLVLVVINGWFIVFYYCYASTLQFTILNNIQRYAQIIFLLFGPALISIGLFIRSYLGSANCDGQICNVAYQQGGLPPIHSTLTLVSPFFFVLSVKPSNKRFTFLSLIAPTLLYTASVVVAKANNSSMGVLIMILLCVSIYELENRDVRFFLSLLRTTEVEKQVQTTNQTLEMKRAYYRYISHEIRTPLSVAKLGMDLVEEDLKELQATDDSLDNLSHCKEAITSAVGILNDLIENEKLESGQLSLQMEFQSLPRIVSSVVRPFRLMAKEKKLSLSFEVLIHQSFLTPQLTSSIMLAFPSSSATIPSSSTSSASSAFSTSSSSSSSSPDFAPDIRQQQPPPVLSHPNTLLPTDFSQLQATVPPGLASLPPTLSSLEGLVPHSSILGDNSKIGQVVRNLLSNALKFTPSHNPSSRLSSNPNSIRSLPRVPPPSDTSSNPGSLPSPYDPRLKAQGGEVKIIISFLPPSHPSLSCLPMTQQTSLSLSTSPFNGLLSSSPPQNSHHIHFPHAAPHKPSPPSPTELNPLSQLKLPPHRKASTSSQSSQNFPLSGEDRRRTSSTGSVVFKSLLGRFGLSSPRISPQVISGEDEEEESEHSQQGSVSFSHHSTASDLPHAFFFSNHSARSASSSSSSYRMDVEAPGADYLHCLDQAQDPLPQDQDPSLSNELQPRPQLRGIDTPGSAGPHTDRLPLSSRSNNSPQSPHHARPFRPSVSFFDLNFSLLNPLSLWTGSFDTSRINRSRSNSNSSSFHAPSIHNLPPTTPHQDHPTNSPEHSAHSHSQDRRLPCIPGSLLSNSSTPPAVGLVLVEVLDSGPGIKPEDQTRLFSESYQINPNKMQAGGGSGLGLYNSRRIVEMHGGGMGMRSEGEGRGSNFFFTLPVYFNPKPPSPPSDKSLTSRPSFLSQKPQTLPLSQELDPNSSPSLNPPHNIIPVPPPATSISSPPFSPLVLWSQSDPLALLCLDLHSHNGLGKEIITVKHQSLLPSPLSPDDCEHLHLHLSPHSPYYLHKYEAEEASKNVLPMTSGSNSSCSSSSTVTSRKYFPSLTSTNTSSQTYSSSRTSSLGSIPSPFPSSLSRPASLSQRPRANSNLSDLSPSPSTPLSSVPPTHPSGGFRLTSRLHTINSYSVDSDAPRSPLASHKERDFSLIEEDSKPGLTARSGTLSTMVSTPSISAAHSEHGAEELGVTFSHSDPSKGVQKDYLPELPKMRSLPRAQSDIQSLDLIEELLEKSVSLGRIAKGNKDVKGDKESTGTHNNQPHQQHLRTEDSLFKPSPRYSSSSSASSEPIPYPSTPNNTAPPPHQPQPSSMLVSPFLDISSRSPSSSPLPMPHILQSSSSSSSSFSTSSFPSSSIALVTPLSLHPSHSSTSSYSSTSPSISTTESIPYLSSTSSITPSAGSLFSLPSSSPSSSPSLPSHSSSNPLSPNPNTPSLSPPPILQPISLPLPLPLPLSTPLTNQSISTLTLPSPTQSCSPVSFLLSPSSSSPTRIVQTSFLLVEDTPLIRRFTRKTLESSHSQNRVLEAVDGREAVRIVRERRERRMSTGGLGDEGEVEFGVILIDSVMPHLSGPEAVRAMREEGYSGLVLGLTGNAAEEDIQEFISMGANAVLSKPLDYPSLLSTVHGLLHR